jgi:hypothetical protein
LTTSSTTPPSDDLQRAPPQQRSIEVATGLPARSELDHDFTEALAHIASIRTRRKLERDPVYRGIKPQLERVLRGFEWDLEPTLGTSLQPRRPGQVRVAAWNVERGKRFEGLRHTLIHDPVLREADLLLLTEVDIGMGRSQNLNVPRELAAALGMGYVFANYHLVLAEGDRGERGHGIPNTKAMHGCALLTRFPVLRFEAVDLRERKDKFHATEKRIGNKRALLCELLLPTGRCRWRWCTSIRSRGRGIGPSSCARSWPGCAASGASGCCSAATSTPTPTTSGAGRACSTTCSTR